MSKKKLWLSDTNEDWLRQNYKNLRWADICKYKHLSETFIREMADQIDWFFVSEDQVFSIDFIREMRNKLSLRHLLSSYKFSEKFLNEIMNNTKNEKLERWYYMSTICATQDLTENFMQRWSDILDWGYVSQRHRNFSEGFLRRHIDKLNITALKKRGIYIPQDLLDREDIKIKMLYESIR